MAGVPEGDHSRRSGGSRMLADSRVLGFALSVVLLASACRPKTEIVYVDPKEHGAYTSLGRSADPRVHKDGTHQVHEKVQVGPGAGDGHTSSYTPIGSAADPRVHASGKHQIAPKVAVADGRGGSEDDDHGSTTSSSYASSSVHATSSASLPAPSPKPALVAQPAAAAKPAAVAKPAASPVAASSQSLTMGLGTVAEKPSANAPLNDDGDAAGHR